MQTTKQNCCIKICKIAGCEEELIENCMLLAASGDIWQMIKLLSVYKETILASIHRKEKHIDCVDFLIFSLKKELK